MANEVLIRKVVAAIEESERRHDPKKPHWNQDVWAEAPRQLVSREEAMCGTQACFAGWTVFLAEPEEFWGRMQQQGSRWVFDPFTICDRARELLELDPDQADDVFSYTIETIDELKYAITEATGVVFDDNR